MAYIYILGFFAIIAYLVQAALGFIQIKHFTKTYGSMRRQGRVAIGRKAGKFKAGTIVMFSIDSEGIIIEGKKIQGTTILARFKTLSDFTGLQLEDLNQDLACVAKENKLTQLTILDAVNTYQKVRNGEVIVEKQAPLSNLALQAKMMRLSVQNKFKRSVSK